MKKVLLILMLVATTASAETYQWTDKEGTVHFSQSLASVPAGYRKSAQPLRIDPEATTTGNQSGAVTAPGASAAETGGLVPQIDELTGRMMNDEGIMKLINALQSDPEMQDLLKDPAVLTAVQSGNVAALIDNPTFMKLLDNPRVRQIEKKLQQGGAK